ncbi:MAG TPA: hypothetical protein DCG57_13875 [Candidatus Riflebacteria bacterium]|nr:MAG: hypothetical protein CVV41_16495 [Candidatus Riflebacteria bacterium HGW-Riflebacteria-1]HAE39702.1 hypothetical protein [Candidatus Riflebacteria bacterium]
MNKSNTGRCPARSGGFTLIEIMIVITIISVLMMLVSYSYVGIRGRIRKTSCMENMRVIYKAATLCQTERNDLDSSNLTEKLLFDQGYLRRRATCPSKGRYWIQGEKDKLRVSCVETQDGSEHGYFE